MAYIYMLEGYTRPAMKQAISIYECKWIFSCSFLLSKETDDIMATISLELLENVGFVNKSQLWLVEPKIPGTRNTEAYQLHGHTPIVGTAHDRSSTRSIHEKEH